MDSKVSIIEERLDVFLEEIDGIELVLSKLEKKNSVSVFDKLCANCESAFGSIASLDVEDIVDSGLTSKVIDALVKFRSQLVRLQNYKEALISYIEMTQSMEEKVSEANNSVGISANNPFLQNKNKTLDLNKEENAA